MTLASHWDRGTQGRQRSKGRSLPGYGLTRLSGGASEVLGRAAWAPVLHLLLGHSESPAWPPSHSDNRKVNTPPPPGLRSGQRGSGAASGAPPRLGQPARGYLYPGWGHGLGCALTHPATLGGTSGAMKDRRAEDQVDTF